jgi:hypothetical protein
LYFELSYCLGFGGSDLEFHIQAVIAGEGKKALSFLVVELMGLEPATF